MSLRTKLLWPVFILIIINLLIQWVISYSAHQVERKQLIDQVKATLKATAPLMLEALQQDENHAADSLLESMRGINSAIDTVALYDRTGSLHAIAVANTVNQSRSAPPVLIKLPLMHQGEQQGSIRFTITTLFWPNLSGVGIVFLGISIGSAVIIVLFMWYRFRKLVITPLDKLNTSIHQLSIEPRLVHQIAHQSTDEVGSTITSFNVLLHRMQQRKEQLKYNFEQCDKEKTLIQQMCNLMSESLIVINAEGGVVYVNEAAKRTFKRYLPVRGHTSIYDLFPTNRQEELKALIDTNTTSTELTLSLHERSLRILCRKFRHQENTFLSIKDISEEEQVLSKQRAAARVFETSQDGLIVLNQEGIITMINPAVTKLLGVSAEQAVGEPLFRSIRWRKLQALMPTIIESIKNYGHWQGEIVGKKSCGQLVPLFAKVNRIDKHSHNDFYEIVIMLTDLSGVKEMEYLKYQVHHDALTGLANRTKFTSQLQQLLSRSRYLRNELAVLFLDLDGFKQVNDTYGHDAGDTVLQVIAERLALLSGHNDMVARFSGDEFVMLVNPATTDIVRQVAEEVIASVSKPIFHKGIPLTVGVSIGVKLVGPEENDPKHILAHADTAMYQAKQAGKGQAFFIESESYEGV